MIYQGLIVSQAPVASTCASITGAAFRRGFLHPHPPLPAAPPPPEHPRPAFLSAASQCVSGFFKAAPEPVSGLLKKIEIFLKIAAGNGVQGAGLKNWGGARGAEKTCNLGGGRGGCRLYRDVA